MESLKRWLRIGVPAGWNDVSVRTVKAAVVAFAALMIKERIDAAWDAPACVVDAVWVAGGTFLLNAAVLALAKPRAVASKP